MDEKWKELNETLEKGGRKLHSRREMSWFLTTEDTESTEDDDGENRGADRVLCFTV